MNAKEIIEQCEKHTGPDLITALKTQITLLCRHISEFDAPDTTDFVMTYYGEFADYVVHYEYEREQDHSEFEPGWAENVTLTGVYACGMDVLAELSDKVKKEILETCLDDAKQQLADEDRNYGEEVYVHNAE